MLHFQNTHLALHVKFYEFCIRPTLCQFDLHIQLCNFRFTNLEFRIAALAQLLGNIISGELRPGRWKNDFEARIEFQTFEFEERERG